MTGRYPRRVGGGWTTNAEEVTIAEILRDAGYATGCVGKWELMIKLARVSGGLDIDSQSG